MAAGVISRVCFRRPGAFSFRKASAAVVAAFAARRVLKGPTLADEVGNRSREPCRDADLQSRWAVRTFALPDGSSVEMLEGRFVFLDGPGVHVWPAAMRTLEYLTSIGFASDRRPPSMGSVDVVPTWQGRKVLELGCGCGLVAVALARSGANVVATDISAIALDLAKANAQHNLQSSSALSVRRLDWCDRDSCAQLLRDHGPFDAVVVADGVLVTPPSGPMWRRAAQEMAAPPGQMLEATRQLSHAGTEVIVVVTDRAGDVAATARFLLDRRQWLDLLGPPIERLPPDGESGPKVVIFHFRWKFSAGDGGGGDVARKLWSSF